MLKPVANASLIAGTTHNVTWRHTGSIGWVSLFLLRNGAYDSKIAFMIEFHANVTCEDKDEDDDCDSVQERAHDGVYDGETPFPP